MTTFFTEFSDYLETIVLCKEQLVVVGDFNIHVDVPDDSDSTKFLDLLESFSLQQHVMGSTHIHGHTLDLVITRQSDQILRSTPRIDRYFSDHASVLCHLHSIKPSFSARSLSFRKLKSVNVETLNDDLAKSDLCKNPPDDLDELVVSYNKTLTAALDKYAPVKTRTIVVRPRVPWYTEEIRHAKRERRKAERRWRLSKLNSDLVAFKIKRNAVNNLMNRARQAFYTNFIEENSFDQRKLFRASKRLFNQSQDDGLPPNLHAPTFANELGKYFVTKIDTIRRQIDADITDLTVPVESITVNSNAMVIPTLSAFKTLSDKDVKSLIQNSALKTCPLDPMPSRLVSKCDALLPVITSIVNKSLEAGHFPESWKEALVCPLLKKPGLDITFKNFRPVSNLAFLSKLTEKAVFHQIHDHVVDVGLYPIAQSAYRENHSTETALLKVKNDILLNMNKQHVTLLVLLDLSAAFDTVDHDILLKALKKRRIGGRAFEWFRSYLSGRCQRILVRGCQSESFYLNCGVPQGSCLGPLLFTIYTSSLLDVIQDFLPSVHCYADDTQLYISFSPADETGHSDAIAAIERCIQVIRSWMHDNKLLLNEDKTEFLLIGTKQQLAKVNISHITVGNANIAPQSPVKNLGVWLDSNLSMVDHITKTSSAAFYHLYNIRRIRSL
ncbi:hypothetical protein ACROYT_G034937 [Oculina patagonica]